MKCAQSDKTCLECESNPGYPIYSERYVLVEQLKKLRKTLDETQTILKAIRLKTLKDKNH